MGCPGSLDIVLCGGISMLVLFPFSTPSPGRWLCAYSVGGGGDFRQGWGEIDHIPALTQLTEYDKQLMNNQVSR